MTLFEINIFWFTLAPSYYGLMYGLSFLWGYYYLAYKKILSNELLETFFSYIILWVILWWRIWYILFYDFSYYFSNPLDIIKVWEWWMSFHGGLLWVIASCLLFCKKYKIPFLKFMDEIAIISPIGIFLWRIWNYLNQELLGFAWYSGPFAIIKNGISYFPSPLLEAFLEWIVLFTILFFAHKKKKYHGRTAAYFLIFYSIFRIGIELFIRTPDSQIGYIANFFTLWSLLSIPMFIGWIILFFYTKKHVPNYK